jgi:putative membrane protein
MMDPKHKAASDKLSRLSGADFDREYMRMMVKDHAKKVEMFEREATKGKDPDVKAWAAKTLPTVREHLQMARDLNAKTDASSGKDSTKDSSNKSGSSSDKRP